MARSIAPASRSARINCCDVGGAGGRDATGDPDAGGPDGWSDDTPEAGADGLVLFNRFYQPDIDAEELTATRTLHLSDSSELRLRLHWMAILSGRVRASLAVTGGVHTALDVVKATMSGAHVTQTVSALLMHGPEHLRTVVTDLAAWMQEHEWDSLGRMRGNMNLARVPDPDAYERANYMLLLQSWRA